MTAPFRVGVTRDILNQQGELFFDDLGFELFDEHPGVSWEILPDRVAELTPAHARTYDAILLLGPLVTASTLADGARLAVLARFGVGYDSVDVDACTRAGVAITITPDGVRRPVASAMLAMVLALAHRIKERGRLAKESRWADKVDVLGTGLTGRTLGIVGLGNIGRDFSHLARPFEMRHLAFDPYASDADAAGVGAELVSLETLLEESDYVCVCCPLTAETHHLIGAEALARMKPTAALVNAGRGAIVDEAALIDALQNGTIASAALDVFEQEPPEPDNPLLDMEQVLVTPHCIAHTDELLRLSARSACRSILAVADGRAPDHVVNRDVLTNDAFTKKLRATVGSA